MNGKIRSGLAALGASLVLFTGVAEGASYQLRIGAGHPASAVWVGSLREYFMPKVAERVAKETGNTIQWTEAWGGSVCKLGECLEAVESGLLDIADVETAFEPAKLLAHNFTYFVPFGAPDPRVAQKAAATVYESIPGLKKVLEDRYRQVFLGASVVGNYGLATTVKWNEVAELRGHKIAAAGPNLPWLEGTGVVGVQSNLNEAYTSFQTGVYEGWVMFPDALVSFKLYEVIKQYSDMDFGSVHTPLLTINRETWRGLPAPVQKIFLEVGKEWGERTAQIIHEKTEEARAKLREAGLDVRQSGAEAKRTWAKSLPNIPKRRFEEINKANQPGEAVYAYIKALKAAGVDFPRDWEAER